MSKLPIFKHFLSVGNVKPKLKWFFKPKLEPKLFYWIVPQRNDSQQKHILCDREPRSRSLLLLMLLWVRLCATRLINFVWSILWLQTPPPLVVIVTQNRAIWLQWHFSDFRSGLSCSKSGYSDTVWSLLVTVTLFQIPKGVTLSGEPCNTNI